MKIFVTKDRLVHAEHRDEMVIAPNLLVYYVQESTDWRSFGAIHYNTKTLIIDRIEYFSSVTSL